MGSGGNQVSHILVYRLIPIHKPKLFPLPFHKIAALLLIRIVDSCMGTDQLATKGSVVLYQYLPAGCSPSVFIGLKFAPGWNEDFSGRNVCWGLSHFKLCIQAQCSVPALLHWLLARATISRFTAPQLGAHQVATAVKKSVSPV